MNTKRALHAPLLALLLTAGLAWAGDLTDASLNKLMELSGINRQIAMAPQMIAGGVDEAEQEDEGAQDKSGMSKQDYAEMRAAIVDSFQADTLLQAISASIRKNVSEADAKKVLAWLESDLGKKFTQAEVDSTSDAAQSRNSMNDARALLADKERVELARKLDKLQHETDDIIAIQVQMQVTAYVAITRKLHPDQAVDEQAIKKEAMAGINRASIEQSVILDFLSTYRNIAVPDLKKYVEALGQPAMRRFNDALSAGLIDGMNKCAAIAADKIIALTKKKKTI